MGNAMQAVKKPCFSQYLLLPFAYKLLGLHVHVYDIYVNRLHRS